MKKTIALITNAEKNSGVGSRAYQLMQYMEKNEDFEVTPVLLDGRNNTIEVNGRPTKKITSLPGVLGSKSISWIRLAKHIPSYDIYDLSNQTLSFISKKRKPSIVTVHDIIELIDPQDAKARFLNTYLLSGIMRADRIVAVSQYTKQSIQEYFGIPETMITVIHNGVNDGYQEISNYTSSIAYQELLRDFGLINRTPIIISVGSEHPRKNMKTILRTIAHIKKQFPHVLLLKIGDAGILSGRRETLDTIDQLDLRNNVKLLGNVPTERVNELYQIADALVFPSHHEGFGMPPLEAMAAGCPVVCSNTTSIPEIVGDAAIMHESDDFHALAKSIIHIMTNAEFRHRLIEKGRERVTHFSWKKAAHDMLAVYKTLV